MRTHMSVTAVAAMVTGAMMISQSASAEYSGLSLQHYTSVNISGSDYDVWRVYANFSNAGDRLVVGGFGSPNYGPITLQSRNSDDTGFGNPFFNVGNNTTAPYQSAIDLNPALQWDTFATVGVSIGDMAPGGDMTSLTPGFVGITGNNWSQGNLAWYVLPTFGNPPAPPLQSVAGWAGDGDLANRVLMMQLTVSAGDNIRGTINLDWFPPVGQGEIVSHESIQTFNSFNIPTPGALAMFGLGAVMMRGRRRMR